MGHNGPAALWATLIVGALPQDLTRPQPLVKQPSAAHQAVLDHGQDATVTGQLLRIGLTTERAFMVDAGHPGRCGCVTAR